MLISVEGNGTNQLQPGQESMGDAPEFSYRALLRKLWPVYRSIVAKEKPTVRSPFFGVLPSDRIPKAPKHSLFTAAIPVNYIREVLLSYTGELRNSLKLPFTLGCS